jgi:hypothetical protein
MSMGRPVGALAQEEWSSCWQHLWASSSFHLSSIWTPSLLEGAAHIEGTSPCSVALPYVNHLWTRPHGHAQKWASLIWVALNTVQLTIKLSHHRDDNLLLRFRAKTRNCQAPVTHTCNPSYSGGRDQEDHSSKPAWANSAWDLVSKKPITIKGSRSGSSGRAPA